LFGYGKSIVNLDAEIPDGALDFAMAELKVGPHGGDPEPK
jgi:hypothetical protein